MPEAQDIFHCCLKELCNIATFQKDLKTSEENLKLLLFLSKYEDFQASMEECNLSMNLAEYAKLLVLNKNVCEEYSDSVNLYLETMLEFIYNRPERSRAFVKAGGFKRLKSLPKFLIEKEDINEKIHAVMAQLNQMWYWTLILYSRHSLSFPNYHILGTILAK